MPRHTSSSKSTKSSAAKSKPNAAKTQPSGAKTQQRGTKARPKKAGTVAKPKAPQTPNSETTNKRAYNSPLREQQSAETREKIITAGAELVHGYLAWDWKNLNSDAVAKHASVGKRTVQRYFPTEGVLRDAILQRIVEESGIELASIQIGEFAETVASMFRYLQSFSVSHVYPYDSTFKSLDDLRRDVLLDAVSAATPKWSEKKRVLAAAMLDIFWQPTLLERLTTTWGLDVEDSVAALSWLINSIEAGIKKDSLPKVASEE